MKDVDAALAALKSEDPQKVAWGVRSIRARLRKQRGEEFQESVEALCGLFYIDVYDRPDLEPAIGAAVVALGHAGRRAIPTLLAQLEGTDLKSHMHLALALGLMAEDAVPALRRLLAGASDAYAKTFALYALGKVRHPSVAGALPLVLASARSHDKEVRDSAARTIGKIVEVTPRGRVSPMRRRSMFTALVRCCKDEHPAVRAKAVRSLGKMADARYLTKDQMRAVAVQARALLGRDETYDWDRAFIVRREAEETLRRIESVSTARRRSSS